MKIVDNLGIDLAGKLIDLLPGHCVFVSKSGYISTISKYISPEDAKKLAEHYGGEKIGIPMKVDRAHLQIRNMSIMKRLRLGASINLVAAEFGLSRSQIKKIKREALNVAL